jgi:hypothetical protein
MVVMWSAVTTYIDGCVRSTVQFRCNRKQAADVSEYRPPVQIRSHVSYRRMVNVRNTGGIYHDISEAVILYSY